MILPAEEGAQTNRITGGITKHHQITAFFAELSFSQPNALHPHRVNRVVAVVVIHLILAEAFAEDVGVGTVIAG